MNELDLEVRLKNWYAGFTPEDSAGAVSAVATAVVSARARSGGASRRPWLRPAFALAAVAAAVLALVAVPMLWRPQVTPMSTASTSPSPTSTASPEPSRTHDLWAAVVDEAGPIPGGGMWAVSGSSLLISLDGGETWTASTAPATQESVAFIPSTTFIDPLHAWTVRSGPGSSFVVYRTADGGRTWQSATIPGNPWGNRLRLMFADAEHGFLVMTTSGAVHKMTVYRTSDGGATWTAGLATAPASDVSISDATTLWAASYGGGALCNACGEPLLRVSRDSGRTWSTADIAGYAGKLTTDTFGAAGAPVFLDPSTGYIVVHGNPTDMADGSSSVFRTTDGGRTWSLIARAPYWLPGVIIVDATHWFGQQGDGTLVATSDAGKTWRQLGGESFLSSGPWFVDPLHGGAVLGPKLVALADGTDLVKVLSLTADGGISWHPADLGSATPTRGP